MRLNSTFVATIFLAYSVCGNANELKSDETLYKNEKPIEFEANNGDRTDAIAGHLMVPENRNNPNSRKIRINYVRFPATGDKTGEPIIYLAGGPGVSGIGTAEWRRYPLFQELRKFGDVIALDQRGTGKSEQAETCISDENIPMDEVISDGEIENRYRRAARECLTRWQEQGVDVYGYTSMQNALDLNDLRKHLDADKLTLWGISYGSHLALTAMKTIPEYLDKVIIASAEGLDQTVKLPSQTDLYFNHVQEVINQQELKAQVPDLPALMARVHQSLDEKPIALIIKNKDDSNTKMLFQKYHLQLLASMMIADPNQYLAMLVQIYVGLDNDNTELLEGILQRGIFKDEPITFRLMPLAMDVASGISKNRLAAFNRQAETSLLEDKLNFPMPLLNMLDERLDLGDEFRLNPASSVPTLLFTGTLDGRTYPQEQLEAVSGLTNLTQITVKHAGHNLYTSSPEILDRMKSFLNEEPVSKQPINLPLPILSLPSKGE